MTDTHDRLARALACVPLGAAAGGAVGVLTILGILVAAGDIPSAGTFAFAALFGFIFGAPTGAVLGPLVGTLLLADVPFGRVVLVTGTASAVAGGVAVRAVAALDVLDGAIVAGPPGAVVGCLLAAVWLRMRRPRAGGGRVISSMPRAR